MYTRLNLNKFTSAESLIHLHSKHIPGIHTPLTYFGSFATYFGLHVEDCNLNSINFPHSGESKLWYFVPLSENEKLERLVHELGRAAGVTCKKFIRQSLMISLSVLRLNGIKFGRVIQRPGEFVLSFSGGYHQGINFGFNRAEAINFGTERWLQFSHI